MGSSGFKLFGKTIVNNSSGHLAVQAPAPTMCKDAVGCSKGDQSYTLLKEYEVLMEIKGPSIGAEDAEAQSPAIRREEEAPIRCPRCFSLDTRFCYFNNHDVEQPRHFCKACQRFWTIRGFIRDLPVGSGLRNRRRKSGMNMEKGGISRAESTGSL
ncbi:hypothetical protein EJ110_NYTH33251 [Nymphaea thermarum]|nr:hypothetical protein EJ110_NYTH33251 [Nymphaea thermarum]